MHEPPEDNPTIDNEEEANEQQEDNEEQQESEDNEQQEVEVDNEEQQESEHEEEEPETETEVRRSTRTRKEVDRLNLNIHGILKSKKEGNIYESRCGEQTQFVYPIKSKPTCRRGICKRLCIINCKSNG